MTREDVKTINKELIKRDLLDEYGDNSLKIEELEKELDKYKYNKKSIISAYVSSFATMIGGVSLVACGVFPLASVISLPLIGTSSALIGTSVSKITDKLSKKGNKYSLFQSKKTKKKLEEERLEKLCEIESLKTKNDIINKSIDLLKTKNINVRKKDISNIKINEKEEELDKYITKKVYLDEIRSTDYFFQNISSESKFITTVGFLNFVGLPFLPNPAFVSLGSSIVYGMSEVLVNASSFSAVMLEGINKSKDNIELKKEITELKDKTINKNNLEYIENNKYIDELSLDIAYNKLETLEQNLINKVTRKDKKEDKSKEYIKNYYKLKENIIKRNKAKTYTKKLENTIRFIVFI